MRRGGGIRLTSICSGGRWGANRFPIHGPRFAFQQVTETHMKTAIYVRVSTNRQTQSQTIEQQLERLQRHLELQGERLPTENIFRDDGYSGANLNRPGLDRLCDRMKSGMLDRVLLTNPDRLARNYVHQMVLMEEWERSGCRVEFLDRPMSQDPHDHLLLQ